MEQEKRWESITYAKRIEAANRYGFSITFMGTDENVETQKRFVKFCDAYDKVFISGLRVLLDDYETNRKYVDLTNLIDQLEFDVAELRTELEELKKEKKPVLKTFGKIE
jgi:hypothetical protein